MKYELFIAKRLKLYADGRRNTSAPSLNVAIIGMVLAIVIMILSITIVCGFKQEISNKIYQLDSHIKIMNSTIPIGSNTTTVDARDIMPLLRNCGLDYIQNISLIAEKPAILKTDQDFKGIMYRGVDKNFDWGYMKSSLIAGRIPNSSDTANVSEIIISRMIANQLCLKVGDKIMTYFIDEKVKVRNSRIVGIYSTDFDEFDKTYIIGNIKLIQNVNGWDANTGNYIGINSSDLSGIGNKAYSIYSLLAQWTYQKHLPVIYNVTNTTRTNLSYFSWLNLLDMNVVIILVLMTLVSAFTLVSGLLMIVLERINMIGIMKTLGAFNGSIRQIFIYLTQKLIIKSIFWGNAIGLSLAAIQKYFHIVKLNAEAYYMPYVPIDLDWFSILLLNCGIIIVSYITLIGPSYVISSIKPNKTIRFE